MQRANIGEKYSQLGFKLIFPVLVILLWYLIYKSGKYPEVVFPGPQLVLKTFFESLISGELFAHVSVSVKRVIMGYMIGVSISVSLGLILGWFNKAAEYADYTLNAVRQLPGLAFIPLALMWFGIGDAACLFIIAYSTFWPCLLNTMAGVRHVDKTLIEAAMNLGVKPGSWLMFKEVVFPSSVPHIITGMRIALAYAWGAIVAGEMMAATQGLGWLIESSRRMLFGEKVIMSMLIIGFMGFLIDKSVKYLGVKLSKWRMA
jgi:ABC-type nitrate/sulfonate/bicarbonate transport system permease component